MNLRRVVAACAAVAAGCHGSGGAVDTGPGAPASYEGRDQRGALLASCAGALEKLEMTSTDPVATLPGRISPGASQPCAVTVGPMILRTAGRQVIAVTDGLVRGEIAVEIAAAPAARLSIEGPASAAPGDSVRLLVAALDTYGNRAVDYRGSLLLASTDAWASLPALYSLKPLDRGAHTFVVRLVSTGAQAIGGSGRRSTERWWRGFSIAANYNRWPG
jgi:hypothetical protein